MDTWISDTSDPTDLKIKKCSFVSYLSITWIMTYWVQGNSRILSITRISLMSRFPLSPISISFAYTSQNRMSMEFPRKGKWGTYNYVIERRSDSRKWLLQLGTQCITKIHSFGYQFLGSLGSTDHWSIFLEK